MERIASVLRSAEKGGVDLVVGRAGYRQVIRTGVSSDGYTVGDCVGCARGVDGGLAAAVGLCVRWACHVTRATVPVANAG